MCVPPREAGPWDIKAAEVAAAARQAGGTKSYAGPLSFFGVSSPLRFGAAGDTYMNDEPSVEIMNFLVKIMNSAVKS